MNTSKILRDTVIILVLALAVYAGIQMFGSKNPGPVEQVTTGMPAGPHSHDQTAPPAHMTAQPGFTDGEPIVAFGDYKVGRAWYDDRVAVETRNMEAEGLNPAEVSPSPEQIALISGLIEIIFDSSALEYGIVPDPEEMASRETMFYASFETEDEANAMLEEMGITLDRLRGMWEDDIITNLLVAKIVEMNGLEPGTPEGDDAFQTWLEDKVKDIPWVFEDAEIEAVYNSYIEALVASRTDPVEIEESSGEI